MAPNHTPGGLAKTMTLATALCWFTWAGIWGPKAGASAAQPTSDNAPRLPFLSALPLASRHDVADDAKLLVGWATDAAAMPEQPKVGMIIGRGSSFRDVPSFAAPTNMKELKATYRVIGHPLEGEGYWGLPVEMLDSSGNSVAVILLNRLFRLPVILHEPAGVATDVTTVAALLAGVNVPALDSAENAVKSAFGLASSRGVPLIVCGQSLSGGLAQFQVATFRRSADLADLPIGFITFNAADAEWSLRKRGIDPSRVSGISFVKDQDPGVGPHALLTNRVGLQIYVHADGTGGARPGGMPILSALIRPSQHLLASFQDINLDSILTGIGVIRD